MILLENLCQFNPYPCIKEQRLPISKLCLIKLGYKLADNLKVSFCKKKKLKSYLTTEKTNLY